MFHRTTGAACVAALLVLLVLAGSAMAQDPRGTLSGRVTDSTGAVVPDTEIRATNPSTGVTVSARSNEQAAL